MQVKYHRYCLEFSHPKCYDVQKVWREKHNMKTLGILCAILAILALLCLVIAYVCYYIAFYSPRRKPRGEDEYNIPEGEIYEPYRDLMIGWMKETRQMPHEDVSITSFDGLTLRGKYFEYSPDAPVELMFHGYRGDAERDLCGGVQRCFSLGHSALIVDQRASAHSDGSTITFGINESRDCLSWLEFMNEHYGKDKRIILTGISMGASTVMIAGGMDLPDNVVGILADCGYSSARDIVKKVMRQIHLPQFLYPFVKLAARLFGHFDLEETSPVEALARCKVPVIFFHGESDDFVPCDMSRMNYEACASTKKLVTVPDAGHGLAFVLDSEGYLDAVREFKKEWGL